MFSSFQTVERVVYGRGVAAKLGDEVLRLNCRTVGVITDKGMVDAGIHAPLLASLKAAGIEALLYDQVELDPTPASIEKAAAWVRQHKIDLLVGLGGGSALDSTKATALLAVHEGPMSRYFGLHKVPSACMPTILIPTTAGTGSEMTSNAVLNDPITDSKQGTVSDYLYAKVVLLDPELTAGLPPFYTAITGLDALVHCIESYNFPALVFGWFIPYAIAAGNTFIFKPSTQSPYFMQLICELFTEIGLPAGVVNVIHGDRSIPETWYEDPRMAGVCLVGSTPTAKKMAEGCARGAKRSMLLGGAKNMLLVMEDANMDIFIENFLNSCYGSAGQRCLAGSIVAAVPEIYDTVVARILEASRTVKVGDAFDPDVYMGPLISRAAADNVAKYVDIALAHGKCECILDGRNPVLPEKNKNGFFMGPTIIKDVTPCNPLFTTEVFGPLVATIKVADMDDALNLIRTSEFGNGACIFTQNAYYMETFSRLADVGMVGVNVGICAPHPYVPFGGIKGSLLGTDKVQGKDGLNFFTQNKVTTIRTHHPKGQAHKVASNASIRSCVAS